MHISKVHIQNYRRLKSTSIDIEKERTMFVGANNSGKTSAMQALISFLSPTQRGGTKFNIEDITMSNWAELNLLGEKWLDETVNPVLEDFTKLLPTLDVWFDIDEEHLYSVVNMIPTLSWKGGGLGVRIVLQPEINESNPLKDQFKLLVSDFKDAYKKARKAETDYKKDNGTLSPANLEGFLRAKGLVSKYFKLVYYILDSEKYNEDTPQSTLTDPVPNPLANIIHVDCIYAQRGFNDPNHAVAGPSNLTNQFKDYKTNHLDSDEFHDFDVDAIERMKVANDSFDKVTNRKFKDSLEELSTLNIPGWGNPEISLKSDLDYSDGLNHDSAVQFQISPTDKSVTLSEKYSGLGYQNLVSISFSLIGFRDSWLKRSQANGNGENFMSPIHLVLIEEPEAHLHAQAQRVFIREAYKLLRNHEILGDSKTFVTQLLFSTHSNDIVHEIPFSCLRYFKRCQPNEVDDCIVPTSVVVNLSSFFNEKKSTRANAALRKKYPDSHFVAKYIKYTHCSLFFADALILVEGKAERLLFPKFLETASKDPDLDKLANAYLSILEVEGAHTHKFIGLLKHLGLKTLIVTDIDPQFTSSKKAKDFSVDCQYYSEGNGYLSTNPVINHILQLTDLDRLLNIPIDAPSQLVISNHLRLAYQYRIMIDGTAVYPTTFEDALVITNMDELLKLKYTTGLLKKMIKSISSNTKQMMGDMHKYLHEDNSKKGDMAIQIMLFSDDIHIKVPQYIMDGFVWLNDLLYIKK